MTPETFTEFDASAYLDNPEVTKAFVAGLLSYITRLTRERDEAYERAAKVAEDLAIDWHIKPDNPCRMVAAAIRALKEKNDG